MTHELRDKQIAFTWCSHVGIDDVVFASKLEKALLKAGAAAVHVIHDEERAVAATNSDVLVMIGRDERWASQWTVREANLPVQIKTAPVIRIQPKNGVEHAVQCIDDLFRGITVKTDSWRARRAGSMQNFRKTEHGYVRMKEIAAFKQVESSSKLTR
mmetsp:Transcript_5035/g.15539  ORF Transcript_5035/g.15539 Transcript_5035/m.15539 type:complete len:157 (+) Transcript_5035:38-508(+)